MNTNIQQKIDFWLNSNIDTIDKQHIENLIAAQNHTELNDAFYRDLEFGTGGLRGIMGVGSNRVNKYTIGAATQGLSNYLLRTFADQRIKVAIAYDSRNQSQSLARIVADVFSGNGIYVYLFENLRPTPQLSFTIRQLGCQSGVVLTASHNPKEYNGYKAYWDDGGQVVAPHDQNIMDEVAKVTSFDQIKFEGNDSLIEILPADFDESYIAQILSLSIDAAAIQAQKDLNIVYSSIHGTGVVLVPTVLERMGFVNVNVVAAQAQPDGNFSTVVYPNPEEKEAMSLALAQAQATNADLVMATDPDADRVGIAVKNNNNEFILLNGNQTGALLINYVLEAWQKAKKFKGNEFVVRTIVTTALIDAIAQNYGVACYQTLTGFKYIASLIKKLEGTQQYVAGGEESYGYLIGDAVRDKDAIASCALIAEMTAAAKNEGLSLYNKLLNIYVKHGLYQEYLKSITLKGQDGAAQIKQMMQEFRQNPPRKLGGSVVTQMLDYQQSKVYNFTNNTVDVLDFEASNVLQFITADGTVVSARPSGTEPKIKFYVSAKENLHNVSEYDGVAEKLQAKIVQILADLEAK
jgi:phosphoglucomutase